MTSLKNIIIKITDNWSVTNKLILAITLSSLLSLALIGYGCQHFDDS